MAIKGKGKTKSRGVAKAPRREPVPVPVPFAKRRWVQVTAAFILGLGVFLFAIWVTNGLRTNREAKLAAEQRTQQQLVLQAWQAEVEAQVGKVGTLAEPQPPQVGAQIRQAIKDLQGGSETSVTSENLTSVADTFQKAADDMEKYDLAGQIRDKGFGLAADAIATSKIEFVQSFRAFHAAAVLVGLAIDTKDQDLQKALVKSASEVLATADATLGDAHRKLQLSLSNAGVVQTPSVPQQPLPQQP